jgi:hypothetical protein
MAFMGLDLVLPSSFLIVVGSLVALLGTQMTGKARRSSSRDVPVHTCTDSPLGRGRAVLAGGWFVFFLGVLGLLAGRLF